MSIEAAAKAYDVEWDKPQPEGEMSTVRHERCIGAAARAWIEGLDTKKMIGDVIGANVKKSWAGDFSGDSLKDALLEKVG